MATLHGVPMPPVRRERKRATGEAAEFYCRRCRRKVLSPSLSMRELIKAHWRDCKVGGSDAAA